MVQNKCTIQFNLIQFNFNAPVHVPLGGTFISLECKSTRKLMFVLGEANGTNVYGYLRLKHSILQVHHSYYTKDHPFMEVTNQLRWNNT